MSDDVQVRFGAEIGDINAAIGQIREMIASLAGPVSEVKEAFAGLSESFKKSSDSAKEHSKSLEKNTGAMTKIRELLEGITSPLRAVRQNLGELAEGFAAAFATEKIEEFAEHMADLGLQTTKASEILGISTEQVGGLGLIAQASGVSLEGLQMAFGRMSRNIIEGSDQTKRAMSALGLSMATFRTMTPEAQLETLASKFQGIKDGADKDAIAMALLGRAGVEMIPLLNQGPEAIAKWQRAAEDLGVRLRTETVAAMEETHEQLTLLAAAFQGAGVQAFLEFKDAINGANQIVRDMAADFTNAMRQGGALKDIMDLLATTTKGLIATLSGAIGLFQQLWNTGVFAAFAVTQAIITLGNVAGEVFKQIVNLSDTAFEGMVSAAREAASAVGAIFSNLGAIIVAGLHGDLAKASAAFDKMKSDAASSASAIGESFSKVGTGFDMTRVSRQFEIGSMQIESANKHYQSAMISSASQTLKELTTIFGLAEENIDASKKKSDVHMLGKPNTEGVSAAMKELDGEIKLLQQGLKLKTTIYDADFAQKKISEQGKFGLVEAATQQEYEAELALLQKEAQLGGLKETQVQEINNKIKELQAKHNLDMVKLDEQAVAASQKTWQGYFDTFDSAFNGQLRGLLAHTTSFASAMKSIIGDLIIKLIEGAEKWAFEWAAAELANTTATVTGAAARTAATEAGNTAAAASTIASILKNIAASAAETFAGIFGFLSPVLGPAAAGPAAAGEATVIAAGAAIGGSFAGGSWSLPSDMIAQVHQGEMIVPAAQTPWAQSLMSNAAGGGGGGGVNLTINHTTYGRRNMQEIEAETEATARLLMNHMGVNRGLWQSALGKVMT